MTKEEALIFFNTYYPPDGWHDAWRARECAIEALQEQKTSQLITDGIGVRYCSNCRRIDDKYSVANFCWYCGAKYER